MSRTEEIVNKANKIIDGSGELNSSATIAYLLEDISMTLARICDAIEGLSKSTLADDEPKHEEKMIRVYNYDCISLYDAGFLTKTRNALLRAGYKTLADIKDLSVRQFRNVRGIGAQGIHDIAMVFARYGIALK